MAEVHRWVGGEPTAADPMAFTLLQPGGDGGHGGAADPCKPPGPPPLPSSARMPPGAVFIEPGRAPHPRPFNPFVEAGALTLCALAGRAHYPPEGRLFHDNGSRFSHMMGGLTRLCGGRRIGFNNSVFLAEKQKRLTSLAISFYCKGMGVYPDATDPTQAAHMLFQAEAVETRTEDLAVMAATLANVGTCPLTQERCFEPHVTRSVLSLMYNSGLNRFSGNWAFKVGIPAASGASGATMLAIPGVMGIGIYSPRLNALGVSPRAIKFCQLLTARYRVNIFDRLVYADADVAIAGAEPQRLRAAANPVLALQLCTAAGSGDVAVSRTREEGGRGLLLILVATRLLRPLPPRRPSSSCSQRAPTPTWPTTTGARRCTLLARTATSRWGGRPEALGSSGLRHASRLPPPTGRPRPPRGGRRRACEGPLGLHAVRRRGAPPLRQQQPRRRRAARGAGGARQAGVCTAARGGRRQPA